VLELAFVWGALALPLPLLLWWGLPPHRERANALRVPFFTDIVAASGVEPGTGAVVRRRRRLQAVILWLTWLLLVLALMRPTWVGEPIERTEVARDIMLARVLGAGGVADAWQLAFQLPNLFRRLFAEGAFASAFVPLFNRHMTQDESEARRFAGEVLAVLLPILVVFGAVMMLAMPWVLWLFANADLRSDAATYDLAVTMGRIAFPYLMFMSLATLVAAILNSLSRFAAAAAAPILLNICLLAALVWGALQAPGEATRAATGVGLAIAVSVSGAL